jgi:hypothetical protein
MYAPASPIALCLVRPNSPPPANSKDDDGITLTPKLDGKFK